MYTNICNEVCDISCRGQDACSYTSVAKKNLGARCKYNLSSAACDVRVWSQDKLTFHVLRVLAVPDQQLKGLQNRLLFCRDLHESFTDGGHGVEARPIGQNTQIFGSVVELEKATIRAAVARD